MKSIIIAAALLVICLASTARATTQIPDRIVYEGNK